MGGAGWKGTTIRGIWMWCGYHEQNVQYNIEKKMRIEEFWKGGVCSTTLNILCICKGVVIETVELVPK